MRFRRELLAGAAALAAAGLLTISCGGIQDPSNNQTETFTGTVATRGGASTPMLFNVSSTGEFTVKVTSFTPSFSGTFATYYGQGDGTNCLSLIQSNSFSTVNAPVLQGQIFKGLYCVVVSDQFGSFPTTGETFTMTISHP